MRQRQEIPGRYNPNHELLVHAREQGNEILAANVYLDKKIEQLIRDGLDSATIPDLSHNIDELKRHIQKVLEENEYSGTGTWNDYFRLLSHYELMAEIIYAPILLRHRDTAGCQSLVDGIYGINARILESALDQYDHPDATLRERKQLQGVMHEQVAMALINYAQVPNSLALPSPAQDDLYQKTDIIHHKLQDDVYDTVKIQVKSARPEDRKKATPVGGILVLASDMGNSHFNNFKTARVIVRQNQGTQTDEEDAHLTLFLKHFNRVVNATHVKAAA